MTIAVIAVVGLSFLAMGIHAIAAPAMLVRPFGIRLDQAVSRAEVRAVYGGFGFAMAAVLALAAFHPGSLRTGITVTVAAALGGMAFGRLLSALLGDRTPFYPNWFYCAVESIAAAALLLTDYR
ncbi:DUF4345 domain-containing protein [Nocardia arthritidis]|uniref:DUF4345 domain-containing protein n=1 Tax=Nocardia arthritidis TaxID=228602 RepID=A0A6G9Y8W4_9NOCA|nr:DUF4345 domain-containing protein [Nocardia arthritidis]QIS09496.1 DUF4345 domain-containing protein [Nocardia arthritidis]